MRDVEPQQLDRQWEVPVVAMKVATQCWELCAFYRCITVEVKSTSDRRDLRGTGQGVEEITPWCGEQQLLPPCCLLGDQPTRLRSEGIAWPLGISQGPVETIHDVASPTVQYEQVLQQTEKGAILCLKNRATAHTLECCQCSNQLVLWNDDQTLSQKEEGAKRGDGGAQLSLFR